jgi:transposase
VNTLLKTLFVGCDVSSKNNTVCLMDSEGKEMGYPTFPNTLPGATALEAQLLQVMKGKGFSTLKIATEATSFLDLHLVDFLASSQGLAPFNPSIYQFNPKLVRNFKRAYPDQEKTDKIDAFVITDRLRFGRLPEPYESHRPYLPLRRLTRYRFHLVEAISREKAYFITHLYLKFSAFSVEKPFASLFGATSLALITEFSPDELVNLPVEELTQFIIKTGKNHFKDSEEVVETVKRAARESYRLRPALSSSINLILATILQTIRALEGALKEVDRAIEKEFQAFPNTLQSIKGIGPVYSAGIFSEIGDIHRFPTEDGLAKFAGLTWKRYQSGNFEAEETHMSKTGNEYLRYYLIEASNALRVHNAEYKAYYETKFQEVTIHQHKRALALTARKLVRLVFALLKKGQLYRANYQQEA